MRVLVIGTGGMIGNAVAGALAGAGHEVVCAARSVAQGERAGMTFQPADRRDPTQIADLVKTFSIQVVIDVIAYDVTSTKRLLNALAGQIEQYILLSSCDVYRNYGRLHRTETGPVDPPPLVEDSPLRSSLYPYRLADPRAPDDPQKWLDDYDKIPIEAAVQQFDGAWTILRLPMVFGPRDPQKRFQWAMAPMMAGAETISVPSAWLNWTTSYGYIGNVAGAIAASVGAPGGAHRIFNLIDLTPKPHRAWLTGFASQIGWRGDVQETDAPDHPLAIATATLDLTVPLIVSGAAFVEATGYRPAWDFAAALRETVEASRSELR